MEDFKRFNRIITRVKAVDKSQHSALVTALVAGCKHNSIYAPIAMRETARVMEAILENFETTQGSETP
jgi:hypothetical protein